jgi:hypothetical protein
VEITPAPAAQNLKPAKKPDHHTRGCGQPGKSTNSIKNRYQQTWHTIEFSNNRHTRHHPNQTFRIAPEQLFKLTRSAFPLQISEFGNRAGKTSQETPGSRPWTQKSGPVIGFRLKGSLSQFFRFSGGDSENFTRPPAPGQIGRPVRLYRDIPWKPGANRRPRPRGSPKTPPMKPVTSGGHVRCRP